MIASVVATLEDSGGHRPDIVTCIKNLPGVETGDPGDDLRRIPITIDSSAPNALEDITRQIQQCPGVAFVDVVFVHFEEASVSPSAPAHESRTTHES